MEVGLGVAGARIGRLVVSSNPSRSVSKKSESSPDSSSSASIEISASEADVEEGEREGAGGVIDWYVCAGVNMIVVCKEGLVSILLFVQIGL